MRFFISAAEPSADGHGARLIRAARQCDPEIRFVGVAGDRMTTAGCHRVFDMTRHSAMLLGAAKVVRHAIELKYVVDRLLRRMHFDAAVVIDSPTLHLPMAKKLHGMGIPVLYYIAPQLWAWGKYRMGKLRNHVDALACILPFEEEFFRAHGVHATYVGHPLAEVLTEAYAHELADRVAAPGANKQASRRPHVALLPGSRTHVVQEVLPGQIDVAKRLRLDFPDIRFGISVANTRVQPIIRDAIISSGLEIDTSQSHQSLIASADLALVASGTTSLEVAFHGTPMIVMYNASRLMYQILGRWMIHTKYLSLPNIIAGECVVPEYMPYYRSIDPIAADAISLLRSDEKRARMRRQLLELTESLRTGRASENTAQLLLDLAHGHHA